MMPQDMTAAFDFFRRLRDVRQDQGMRREDLMWMVLASALEQPQALEVFWLALVPKLGVEPTASDVSDCIRTALQHEPPMRGTLAG
jgi:hypothetical protein